MTDYKAGDLVRRVSDDRTFTLDDVNPNPNYKEDDEYYASGMGSWGTHFVSDPSDIVLVMNEEDAKKRKIPSAATIASALNLTSIWGDDFEITETQVDGDSVSCYATASNGLEFSFNVVIEDVYKEGW